MKTLAVILNHNLPKHTDTLYELIAADPSDDYDLAVIDNGSDSDKESKYTTYKLDENVFFGGALNAAMELVDNNDDYDSLLWLNNDLIVGKNFVKNLRHDFFVNGWNVGSPCVIQPEKTQNHWQQMLCWNTNKSREVKWIDLQCPLISKKFIHQLHQENGGEHYIDPLFIRGWGPDVYFGILAEKWEMRTAVVDYIPVVHLGSLTLKSLGNTNEYCRLAEQGMYEFFNKKDLMQKFIGMRNWAENYKV